MGSSSFHKWSQGEVSCEAYDPEAVLEARLWVQLMRKDSHQRSSNKTLGALSFSQKFKWQSLM